MLRYNNLPTPGPSPRAGNGSVDLDALGDVKEAGTRGPVLLGPPAPPITARAIGCY
jgi:hypothetical protein